MEGNRKGGWLGLFQRFTTLLRTAHCIFIPPRHLEAHIPDNNQKQQGVNGVRETNTSL